MAKWRCIGTPERGDLRKLSSTVSLTLLECILTLDWASLDDKVVGKPRGKMLRAAAPGMNLSILEKFKDIFRCKDSPVFKGHRVALVIQYLVSPPEPRMPQE
uniref:Uncharacterized protein n=1 Tax=Fusarium oxysporum (strain Fo5176) TaxID=660025 RepID=A0A0D2YET9_FUSOF